MTDMPCDVQLHTLHLQPKVGLVALLEPGRQSARQVECARQPQTGPHSVLLGRGR